MEKGEEVELLDEDDDAPLTAPPLDAATDKNDQPKHVRPPPHKHTGWRKISGGLALFLTGTSRKKTTSSIGSFPLAPRPRPLPLLAPL